MAKIKVTQTKSSNGRVEAQKATLRGLGLRRIGHTEVEGHPVQKIGLRQRHPSGSKVALHIEHQPVGAHLERGVVIQRAIRVAAIGVQREAFHQGDLFAVGGVKRHLHAGGGAAVHRVQYVCAQAHQGLPGLK